MTDVVLNGSGEAIPGRRMLEGTDLELAYNLQGEDLILRVNKAGVLVFRVQLRDAAAGMLETRLVNFNSVAPDFPRIAGQHYDYIVQAITGYKTGARKSPVMMPMVDKLTQRDIEDLAAYFSQQKGLTTK